MISYAYRTVNGHTIVDVKLVGKKVGEILAVEASERSKAGFAYFPKGHADLRGEVFPTVNLVKASLEAE